MNKLQEVKEKGFVTAELAKEKNLIEEIARLKKEKNAVILAHYYQQEEIQDIADFIGDSLGLAQEAAKTNADVILFAGVHFMGETAKILNPTKKVIIPDLNAGCSLADSAPTDKFEAFLKQYPNHTVISYINCSAEIKALSDIICTSSNAVKIVDSLPKDEKIIFAPDINLGKYVAKKTGRNLVLWDGACEVHVEISVDKLKFLQGKYPNAELIAHPECQESILDEADFVGSTTALLKHVEESNVQEFIVATEVGIIHKMKQAVPHKKLIPAPAVTNNTCACSECPYMKLNTLEKIHASLVHLQPEIFVEESIRLKALKSVNRMLELS
ncbi:MAG: quinolinate synthase [Flavobacteriales bacterium CG18_big_fil_WC_8_21_14_2_50_32_9]|nr:MAG: quinolinate synthase [Flavobacteriales bacterium CG18_big_fil_WC_8_21_14_2_50_32_9]PIZ06432.1 MAG: quinolinate synthase [Flavobacteriales bacterium CG_4_10_14_0_8_um_filter_32_5]